LSKLSYVFEEEFERENFLSIVKKMRLFDLKIIMLRKYQIFRNIEE
jgi:hypothetical protein